MEDRSNIPPQTLVGIFLRFLRFGLLAWGGPVAQIAMIRHELVEEEKWITPQRFNRVLAVYQALPGPEAHELCVYFGMIARRRIGAFLAGLGFMLPGFLLMLTLSWFYVTHGIGSPAFRSVFMGMQPAVAALIVRAVYRIGGQTLHQNKWLWALAILAGVAQLFKVNFLITLGVVGVVYTLAERQRARFALALAVGFGLSVLVFALGPRSQTSSAALGFTVQTAPSLVALLTSGLRAGLLTFGGAYTAIPFIQHDAVQVGRWLTNAQFLDGFALSGLLPAPLIIFSTFVGYLVGGVWGAVAITMGVFAPSFAFTMLGHEYLERLIENRSAHAFLDGITAGVVGLISITALEICRETLSQGMMSWLIFGLALLTLFLSKSKGSTALIVLGSGILGFLIL